LGGNAQPDTTTHTQRPPSSNIKSMPSSITFLAKVIVELGMSQSKQKGQNALPNMVYFANNNK
jgi:hypothetical protein